MFEGSSIDQKDLDEIKARYGIGGRASGPSRFPVVLIRPSRYDDDGYVIQWYRSAMASSSLAVMYGLVEDCVRRKVLGEHVAVEIHAVDEDNTRIRTQRLARRLKDAQGLVILAGVQSNQFSRAMDLALPLRVAGVQVSMGGIHVSSSVSASGGATPEMQEAMNLGISLFVGEAEEGRLDAMLNDAWRGQLKPLYNYLNDPPSLAGAPPPMLTAKAFRGTMARFASFETQRGGRPGSAQTNSGESEGQSRRRGVDGIERIVRDHLQRGIGRFLITDDCFSDNPEWEAIFDRLITMREQEGQEIVLAIEVDRTSHRLPGFIEKATRAGVQRVFVQLDLRTDRETAMREYRSMLQAWKRVGVIVSAGYAVGVPGDTPESVLGDVRRVQRGLAVDLLEPRCVAAVPGPEESGTDLRSAGHATSQAEGMTGEQCKQVGREAWTEYYKPEHMETVLRRAAATGVTLASMMELLVWFHFCVAFEKVDPLEGGYLRRKHRTDRRPTMPKEGWLKFWTRYGWDVVYKHWKIAGLYLRFRRFVGKLERDEAAKSYTDAALTAEAGAQTPAMAAQSASAE